MEAATAKSSHDQPAPLLRTSEVAHLLGMSREQVWRLWTSGRLPGYKLDRHLRFAPRDVDVFLRQHYRGDAHATHHHVDAPKRQEASSNRSTAYQRI